MQQREHHNWENLQTIDKYIRFALIKGWEENNRVILGKYEVIPYMWKIFQWHVITVLKKKEKKKL